MKKSGLTAFILVLFSVMIFTGCGVNSSKVVFSNSNAKSVIAPLSSIEKVKQSTTVRLMAVGDNLIHSSIYKQANQRAGGKGYDFEYAYKNIENIIKKADLPIINQETVIASMYEPSTYPLFNSPKELGDHMIRLGFRAFNHANNHVLDKGTSGLISTLNYWKTKKNIVVCGAYRNKKDLNTVKKLKVKDITFSFIGITEHTNGINLPKKTDIKLIYSSNESLIKSQIIKAKKESEVCVVNIHWGIENSHVITQKQRELAKKMVDWGADIILGTHPHVLQSIEYIKKTDGNKALVIYSLGNFISAQSEAPNLIGGILDFEVVKNYEKKLISIKNVSFIPTVTQYENSYKNIRLYPFNMYTKTLANKHGVRKYDRRFSYEYIQNTIKTVIDKRFLNLSK